ncbi:MAG: putative beta-lysine N-acetyltransferase [Firmicutes bacterium]|nr:putative beta-lysine N-acetyltransferase [Bacillota bacterium]
MDYNTPPAQTGTTGFNCAKGDNNVQFIKKNTAENYLEIWIDHTNSRIKVLDYRVRDWEKALLWLDRVAADNQSGKILFYVRRSGDYILGQFGYVLEGIIPAFFRGDDALCYSRFTNVERARSPYYVQEEELLQKIKKEKHRQSAKKPDIAYRVGRIGREQVKELVSLYREIFTTYPSPLLNPDHVRKVMQSHVCFYGVYAGERLVSAASAEMDMANFNAEITDCATLPQYRGKGFLSQLITTLEKKMPAPKMGALYSLARAGSYGMNAVLYQLGYDYKGRFINNCHIGGRFENMNLWVKMI